jgi:hypothetical protein
MGQLSSLLGAFAGAIGLLAVGQSSSAVEMGAAGLAMGQSSSTLALSMVLGEALGSVRSGTTGDSGKFGEAVDCGATCAGDAVVAGDWTGAAADVGADGAASGEAANGTCAGAVSATFGAEAGDSPVKVGTEVGFKGTTGASPLGAAAVGAAGRLDEVTGACPLGDAAKAGACWLGVAATGTCPLGDPATGAAWPLGVACPLGDAATGALPEGGDAPGVGSLGVATPLGDALGAVSVEGAIGPPAAIGLLAVEAVGSFAGVVPGAVGAEAAGVC